MNQFHYHQGFLKHNIPINFQKNQIKNQISSSPIYYQHLLQFQSVQYKWLL